MTGPRSQLRLARCCHWCKFFSPKADQKESEKGGVTEGDCRHWGDVSCHLYCSRFRWNRPMLAELGYPEELLR